MDEWIAALPRHINLSIEHQPHKSNYESIESYEQWRGSRAADDWASPEQREKAIATDNLWTVQWYPDSPVAFCFMMGADLDVLLARIKEDNA